MPRGFTGKRLLGWSIRGLRPAYVAALPRLYSSYHNQIHMLSEQTQGFVISLEKKRHEDL